MRQPSETRRAVDRPVGRRDPGGSPAPMHAVKSEPFVRLRLSQSEKAMLFDLAMEAGGHRPAPAPGRSEALAAASLIAAFARAYVTIRDREDGIV